MKYSAKYSEESSGEDKPIREKPCLENIPEIDFIPNEKYRTENTLFGPVNNRYKKKTNDELVDAAAWLDEEKCIEALVDLRTFLSTSEEHALKYEEYSTGKSHCESLSTKLEDLLDWFDEKTFYETPETTTKSMKFKENLARLLKFEHYKEDMINE